MSGFVINIVLGAFFLWFIITIIALINKFLYSEFGT